MPHRHGTHGESQRQALIRAAFDIIAQKGFEGLRTREVAARGGVNIATLHYYFPGKQDLVQGVAEFLMDEFTRMGSVSPQNETPMKRLQRELEDIFETIENDPAIYVVMIELGNRAFRDPEINNIYQHIKRNWQFFLEGLLQEGVVSGDFARDLATKDAALTLRCLFTGIVSELLTKTAVDRAAMTAQMFQLVKSGQ